MAEQHNPQDLPKPWTPHIWIGADLVAWLRTMHRGGYAFGPKQAHLAIIATALSAGHMFLRYAQNSLFRHRIKETPLVDDPVFILGHWRCGTTLLHEYMMLDPRLSCPTTSECFSPCHSLLTDDLLQKYFGWMLPKTRLMDNMSMGWDRPQEDEFAMCLLGAPSPYLRLAFPNNKPCDEAAYDLDELRPNEKRRWERTFLNFIAALNLRHRKRLVLKSPPHTCRIPTLLKLFPKARFINIVRNPYTVFASTVNLWKTLHDSQGCQTPTNQGLEEYVLNRYLHFFDRYESTKSLVPAGQLIEIRYEKLVKDPLGQMKSIYESLSLGEFDRLKPVLERYIAANSGYVKNKWKMNDETLKLIASRWGRAIDFYGYSPPSG